MSNNSPSQESTESDSENSIELNVNLDALQKSAFNIFYIQYTSIQEFSEGVAGHLHKLKKYEDAWNIYSELAKQIRCIKT
ncbi:23590_t:CDS:1, partial [Racocetra persica]